MLDLQERIAAIVADQTGKPVSAIQACHRFKEDLRMDSLDLMDVVIGLEEAFQVQITEQDMATLRTVQDAVRLIQGHGHLADSA